MKRGFFLFAFAIVGLSSSARTWTVRVPAECSPWERSAAEILEVTLEKRAASDVLVDGKGEVVFHVGETELAKNRGFSSASLADEDWVIHSFGKNVILAGGGTHGAIYAVSHFLEDFCDVRFWSEEETDVPNDAILRLPILDKRGRPAFLHRNIFRSSDPKLSTPKFAVLRRLNGNDGVPMGRDLGGEVSYGPPAHCHTFDRLIPWADYGTRHPEWFSLWKGIRTGGQYGGQLCLSNPEVRRMLLLKLRENIAQGIADAEKRGVPQPLFYDVSQNDAYARYCQCTNCMGEVAKFGHSGFYLNVVNELAEAIAGEHPLIHLTTLAYEYTEDPPRAGVRPRANVIVKLCNTRSNRVADMADPSNESWRSCLSSWGRVADHLFVWDYAIVYSNPGVYLPLPNEFLIADKFRSYRDNNVQGVFLEHEHGAMVDMYELKFYLETRLLEDPGLDADKLIADFMDRYYGPAGRNILSARRHLFECVRQVKPNIGFMPRTDAYDFVTRTDAEFVKTLLDEAESLVKDDSRRLARVRKARQAMDRLYRLRQIVFDEEKGCIVCLPTAFSTEASTRAEIVADPLSPAGECAVCIESPDIEFCPPYGYEIYDAPARRVVSSGILSEPEKAYSWKEFENVDVPSTENSFLYLSRDWTVQMRLCHPELNGGRFTLRILCRREGRKFFVARLEFAKPVKRPPL